MKYTKQQLLERYTGKPEYKVESIERMRGGVVTYALDVDILNLDGEFIRATNERKTGPAIKPGKFPADDSPPRELNTRIQFRYGREKEERRTDEIRGVADLHEYGIFNGEYYPLPLCVVGRFGGC